MAALISESENWDDGKVNTGRLSRGGGGAARGQEVAFFKRTALQNTRVIDTN